MAKIPYENDYRLKFSKKGKMPWIEFNGQEIADSNFCIQFLKKEFQVDIDCHLSATKKAIAHSIRTMLEENTYWALVYCRWLSDYGAGIRKKLFAKLFGHLFFPLKHLVVYRIKRKIRRDLSSQGIGRHSEQDLYGIAERDLLAVSEILGQKKFLFGEKPSLADVSLFAFIAASAWDCPESPFDELIKTMIYYRWCSDYAPVLRERWFGHLAFPVKYLVFHMIQRSCRKNMWGHGIGRHSEQEVYGIGEKDLLAVSEILGQKKFLFGEKPCLTDAALFAFIAAFIWDMGPECPLGLLTQTKAQNLERHAKRMKELYYPDWDEIISNKHKSG
ncbi:hypothetical protein ACROYT_G030639 [Oculina patagonica]